MKQKQKPISYIVVAIVLYLLSTGVSYALFKGTTGPTVQKPSPPVAANASKGRFAIDPTIPRTELCPLNGALFTKQEKELWEKRRPLAVMIENTKDARPQSGLSYADIVYEAVAEGGVTRFMGLFYCGSAAVDTALAPVRSARTYYVDWVSEYDALYNHVGGAGKCNDTTVDPRAKALCQIDKYGIKDMDQFGLPLKEVDTQTKSKYLVCYRNPDRLDHPVDYEHTMVCQSNGLLKFAEQKRGWTNVDEEGVSWDKGYVPWKFKKEAGDGDRGTTNSISFSHWEGYGGTYGVQWDYDKAQNVYKRSTGGEIHKDLETGEQLMAKDVVIQFTKETTSVDDHAHNLYQTIGTGKALIFQDGKAIVGTWSKSSRTARTKFFDGKGSEIQFNPGQIWIEVVGTGVEVKY